MAEAGAHDFTPTGSVFLVISLLPGADLEEDGSTVVQYKAVAQAGTGTSRLLFAWQGGIRLDRSRLPAGTNQDIEAAVRAALTEQTGYAWNLAGGDRSHLYGGRTS